MILVHVWITLPRGERIKAGELLADDADGHGFFATEFEYGPEWRSHAERFPLVPGPFSERQPFGMPLEIARFKASRFEPPLGVFDDALPDSWGRALLLRAIERKDPDRPRHKKAPPFLLIELGASALGALAFSEDGLKPAFHPAVGSEHLSVLIQAAEDFEKGRLSDGDALHRLLTAGGSPGGARPKALVEDESGHWIAKFPSAYRDEGFDVVGLEAAGMKTAALAGLEVAPSKLVAIGERKALLVKRFDLTAGGRRHMLSFQTLLGERPGVVANGYGELAERLRLISATPSADVSKLFRQMVYNAAIGNTDDHSKNFWVLRGDDGWHLSPAFDLVPNYHRRGDHQLSFQYERFCPTGDALISVGQAWGVENTPRTILEVVDAARGLPDEASRCGVPQDQLAWITRDVEARCQKLCNGLEPKLRAATSRSFGS